MRNSRPPVLAENWDFLSGFDPRKLIFEQTLGK